MQIAECPHCGAPLPETDGATRVVCEFCGTALAPTQASPLAELIAEAERTAAARAVVITPPQLTAPVKAAGRAAAIFFLVFFFAIGTVIWFAVHTATRSLTSMTSGLRNVLPRIQAQDGPLRVADLATARFTGREVPLDVAAPVGGYTAIDAAINLPWALTIAQGWQRDVRLDRVDVERMHPDGTANCRDDAEASVLYRFVSPGRIEELRRQSDLTRNPEGEYEFWVTLKKGQTLARTLRSRSLPSDVGRFLDPARARVARATGQSFAVPPFPAVPPLRQIVATASRQARWVAKPFYDAYMLFSEGEGWVWYISGLSGHDSMSRIRASDGRML